jgi:hypothetical protein
MGHSAEHGLALWATAQNFVKRYGPRRRIIDTAQNHGKFIEKFATTFKGTVRQKIYISIMHYPGPITSMLEILPSLEKKLILRCGLLTQNDILIQISRRK